MDLDQTSSSTEKNLSPLDLESEPQVYRMVLGAVGGQGAGVITEIIYNAIRIERLKYGGEKGKIGSYEKRTMTPGLAQRSGSTITSITFLDPKLSEEELPDNYIMSEMPHQASCDVIIAQELNELMKYIDRCRTDGWVIANEIRSITPPEKMPDYVPETNINEQIEAAKNYLQDGTYVGIDGEKIIQDNNLDPRTLNVVMLGMLSKSDVVPISREAYLEALNLRFQGKIYQMNIEAFELGEKYYAEGRYKERDPDFDWEDLSIDEIKTRSINTALRFRRTRAANKMKLKVQQKVDQIATKYPSLLAKYVIESYGQLVDFQDINHGNWYLDLIDSVYEHDTSERNYRMSIEFAKNMGGRIMQWDGPFRVAEYAYHDKFDNRTEEGKIFVMEKKLQPTLEEIVGMIPIPYIIYKRIPSRVVNWYQKHMHRGWSSDFRTTGFLGFAFFWFLSKFKRIRRWTIRYKRERRLILTIYRNILELYELSHEIAEELSWYIGKIRGYSFIRHGHIKAYHKLVKGVKRVYEAQGKDVAINLIKATYANISKAAGGVEDLDEIISDHEKGEYVIPLKFAE